MLQSSFCSNFLDIEIQSEALSSFKIYASSISSLPQVFQLWHREVHDLPSSQKKKENLHCNVVVPLIQRDSRKSSITSSKNNLMI